MEPTRELIDALYHERVLRARAMPIEEKILAVPRLFDLACRITMDGIRAQFPDASEERVRQILFERVALKRRLEETR
jgi:hypothetical protein